MRVERFQRSFGHRPVQGVRSAFMIACGLVLAAAMGACSADESADGNPQPELPSFDFGSFGTDGVDGEDGSDGSDGLNGGEGSEGTEGTTDVPVCCATDLDCPGGMACAILDTHAAGRGQCIDPWSSGCFGSAECSDELACVDASICQCDDTECLAKGEPEQEGVCGVPVPEGCCGDDDDCADGLVCVRQGPLGECSLPPLGEACWRDSDCPTNFSCVGAKICGCGGCSDATIGGCKPDTACTKDADCPGGSCLAGGACTDNCPQGDPSCCSDNICVDEVPECTTDADCDDGTCQAAGTCYSWCPAGDASCCFGNFCVADPCASANPQGCLTTGCPDGQSCLTSGVECKPSICECVQGEGWSCASDCLGGVCVETTCTGANPQGCADSGCPAGLVCQFVGTCAPSSCSCDESTGSWTCTPDCGGGVCQVP